MARKFANFHATKLKTDINATTDVIGVDVLPKDKTGAVITAGRLVIEARNKDKREIIKYTGVDGTNLTGCVRGDGGTTATTHVKGVLVQMTVTGEDLSELYDAFDAFVIANTDWRPLVTVPTLLQNNGGRELVLRYASSDYTPILAPDTKLRIPRTTSAPTRSAKFVSASSHHANKNTPTGITFASAFSVEGNLRSDAFKQGHVLGMRNGTGGWNVEFLGTGQLSVYYSNGTQNTTTTTYQSMPDKDVIHFACTVNVTTKSVQIYIDGELVPTYQPSSTATTVTHGTVLRMGSYDGTSFFTDATMSNIRLWSTVRTQQEVRDNMYRVTPVNNTGLIGHWKLDGDFNDSSTNVNHLTPNNGLTATNAENPFAAIEFAKVKTVVLNGANTDVTVQAAFGIPNEVLGSTSYSNADSPIGYSQYLKTDVIKYIEVRNDQTPIGAADLNGLTFTINPIPGRRIKLSGRGTFNNNTGSNYGEMTIFEGTNALVRDQGGITGANMDAATNPAIDFLPSPGAHTYKLNLAYFTGAGSLMASQGSAGKSPAWIKAEYV